MLDQLLKQLPVQGEAQSLEAELAPLIAMGEEVLAAGDASRAVGIFAQLLEMAPDQPDVISGLIRAQLGAGDPGAADALIAGLTADQHKAPAIARAISAVTLAKEAKPVDDLSGLITKIGADPADKTTRFELAGGLMAAGDREGAADHLLEIIKQDRDWNDGAARALLLKLFEVVGLSDPWVSAQRRRLSAVLFT
jgi:putative thioredoxin